jgi:hypothetical protein
MTNLAINDKGEAVFYDGQEWKPATVAQNDKGERMVFDGRGWQQLGEGPGMLRRGMNAVGDAAKAVDDWSTTRVMRGVGNLASLPGTVAKGAEWGYRQLGIDPASIFGQQGAKVLNSMATDYPSAEQISTPLLEGAKKAPVDLPGPIGKIVDSAAEGALLSPFGLAAGVGGATAGGLSEAGGQVAREVAPAWEIPVRLGLGVLGGVGGAAAVQAGAKGAKVASAVRKPFTPTGRDDIVGQVLAKGASDPDLAITNLDKYVTGREAFPDAVPGFKIDAGKAARDPGLMAIADAAPDAVRGMRVQQNNAALTGALDKAATGLPSVDDAGGTIQRILADRFKTLQDARSTAATPLYEAARNFPEDLPVGKLFQYTDEVIAANKGEPKAVMESARKLLFDAKGRPDFSARGLMSAREGLGALFTPTLDKHSRSLLKGLQTRIDETLQSIPEAAAGRAKFAEMSVPLEPFGKKTLAGKAVETDPITKKFVLPEGKVLGDLKAPEVQNILMAAGGDPTVKRSLAAAYIDDFRNAVGHKVQRGDAAGSPRLDAYPAAKWMEKHKGAARNVLTDDQIRALDDITKALGDQAQTVPGRVGSQTFDRLGTESIVGALISKKYADAPFLHSLRKTLGLVYGGADEAISARLYEVLADPAMAKALMKKATAGNAKMVEPLLLQLGKGGAAGAVTQAGRE